MIIFGIIKQRCSIKRLSNCVTSIVKNEIRYSFNEASLCVEELTDRGLLEVTGNEGSAFLQGLITNDMRHLDEGSRSMYSMFLNSKGRVMYDAIIYKIPKKSVLYIECDKSAVNDLQKHLKMFRVRRKVEVSIVEDSKIWSIFNPRFGDIYSGSKDARVKDVAQERVVPCQALNVSGNSLEFDNSIFDSFVNDEVFVSWDPRQAILGVRVIAKSNIDVETLAKEKGINVVKTSDSYKVFRYKLGIGEGTNELPNGKCFPLEMNCDYLHGVSFHKGCYIGQELTARTHHTGVVRKRLMPVYLEKDAQNPDDHPLDAPIIVPGEKLKSVGKLRGISGNIAIGLLRISDALAATKLQIGSLTGYTTKPHWWPNEAPKDNLLSKKE